MGSSASKAARKYPKPAELPSRVRNVPQANRSKPVVAQNQLAESRKSEGMLSCDSFFVADG